MPVDIGKVNLAECCNIVITSFAPNDLSLAKIKVS